MSYTEIVAFKNGKADYSEDVKNAFRGAMAVWGLMEKSHLSPYKGMYDFQTTRTSAFSDPNAMKEIWALADNKDVPINERLVMSSTFDNVIVKREDLSRLIVAFRAFDETYNEQSSIGEQADILEEFLKDDEVTHVAWNQTSVNSNKWLNGDWCEETEEYLPYDVNTKDEHWFLFDDYVELLKTIEDESK